MNTLDTQTRAEWAADWPTDALDILKTIELALEHGYAPSDILDENSPIRDRIRAAIAKAKINEEPL